MSVPIDNALALMSWHGTKVFLADFANSGAVWFFVGFLLAVVVLAKVAMEAALVLHTAHRSQSRAGRFADDPKTTIAESSAVGMLE
jgi:hypothetical protein